jgi:UDP-N-acetylglucosamine 4-epimerase
LNQKVVGLDNFSLGIKDELLEITKSYNNNLFTLIEGDINDKDICILALKKVDFVLHHAALGSVPRSISDPFSSNEANISGFLNMLISARDSKIKNFIYASSSSAYGDHESLPKVEDVIGKPKNPYSITKYVNELYANTFEEHYNFKTIGLRYFNVYGPRQRENGDYAAVIPKWIKNILNKQDVEIYGDGKTSRDFCYIDNAVQANIIAALSENEIAKGQVYNISVGDQTSLNNLFSMIHNNIENAIGKNIKARPIYKDFRAGDIRHSRADISKAKKLLNYLPSHNIEKGIKETVNWYIDNK